MHNDYVYHDRKMMKWMPFNALLEQGDYINDLLNGKLKKTMPSLSVDQLEELNYQLEVAFVFQSEVIITYFDNYKYHQVSGVLTSADQYKKEIYLGDKSVQAQKIIKIEIL
jgi:hypothetical protein